MSVIAHSIPPACEPLARSCFPFPDRSPGCDRRWTDGLHVLALLEEAGPGKDELDVEHVQLYDLLKPGQ